MKLLHVLLMQFKVLYSNLCATPVSELKEDEMKKLFLTTGQMRMVASKKHKDHFTSLKSPNHWSMVYIAVTV